MTILVVAESEFDAWTQLNSMRAVVNGEWVSNENILLAIESPAEEHKKFLNALSNASQEMVKVVERAAFEGLWVVIEVSSVESLRKRYKTNDPIHVILRWLVDSLDDEETNDSDFFRVFARSFSPFTKLHDKDTMKHLENILPISKVGHVYIGRVLRITPGKITSHLLGKTDRYMEASPFPKEGKIVSPVRLG